MKLVVLQSNYIPWKGYFDLMGLADTFVIYDSVQYTKNDWRNRNKLPSATGSTWLTIPVSTAGRSDQTINSAEVEDRRWAKKHWQTASQLLARAPYFDDYRSTWQGWFEQASELSLLHDINELFIRGVALQLGLTTRIVDDRAFDLSPGPPTARLVQLCQLAGADTYVTGPSGLNYLELHLFASAGIGVDVIDYSAYPSYQQRGDGFDHGVSVLDLLANVGPSARDHLLGSTSPA
jgi:WbqC-like protein family